MGEYVGHIDFYGITVNWENIFADDVLEDEEIYLAECINENSWEEYNLEKPDLFALCEELNLEVIVVCTTDKVGYMHLGDKDNTAIAIGKTVGGGTIKDKIQALHEAERTVTNRKINEIKEVLGIEKDDYMGTLRLESYYSQG